MTDPGRAGLPIPPGYRELEELARRPGVRVVRARRGEQTVALRLEQGGAGGAGGAETLAELAVLGTVRHPGLARLVDHGPLPGGEGPGGGRFLAREWVEGVGLDQLVGRSSPGELGRIVARLCPALAHLHERGFVHGDLKAANVVVGEGGRPVLTDFGLATRGRGRGEGEGEGRIRPTGVAGSLFHLAPEVLGGMGADEGGDLFALGVLLFSLLCPTSMDARTFYGRFPAQPFFEALGVSPEDLPPWARDLVASLVARDPARRPPSAAWVGSILAGRLGDVDLEHSAAPRLEWPALEGREDFVDARLSALRAGEGGGEGVERWTFTDPGEIPRVARATALRATLAGVAARRVDLGREVAPLAHTVDVDRWARTLARRSGASLLVVALEGDSRWGDRALESLVRGVHQARAAGGGMSPALVVCAREGEGQDHPFPPLQESHVRERLGSWLPGAGGEVLDELASRLHAECHGSSARAEALVQRVADQGWIRLDAKGLRLRPGPLPEGLGRSRAPGAEESARDLSEGARATIAALVVWEGPAARSHLVPLTDLGPEELEAALTEVLQRRLGRWRAAPDGASALELTGPKPRLSALVPSEDRRRAMHRAAADLRRGGRGGRPWLVSLHLARADPGPESLERLRAQLGDLRSTGRTELALDLLGRLGEELDPVLGGELALTWATLGEAEVAEGILADLERAAAPPSPPIQALAARTRAQVATLRQDHVRALEHHRQAARLDPAAAGHALLAEARLCYETSRDGDLATLAQAAEGSDLPRIVGVNVASLAAMAAFRRGEVEVARAGLETSVAEAARLGETSHEAADRINLGIVARHTGRLEEAQSQLERALDLYGAAGFQPGVTQAQAMLGAALRDRGDLARAEVLLAEAVEARERLGDGAGAERARGIHGLALAERGHARAAATSLARSARALGEAGAGRDAAFLAARAEEMEARLSDEAAPAPADRGDPDPDDPRVTLARARTRALGGDSEGARVLAQAALSRAEDLSRRAPAEEARLLLACLEGACLEGGEIPDPRSFSTPTVAEDVRILGLLAGRRGERGGRFDGDGALDLARELVGRGRDDRAARLAIAVAALGADPRQRHAGLVLAEETLGRCSVGCGPGERHALGTRLLGIPDPYPEDLEALERDEELDMEVLSLLDINQRLVDQQDLPQLLGAIVESALEVAGAERGFLVLEEDGELSLDLAMDSRRGDIAEPEVEVSHSVLREALERGTALRLSNAAEDPVLGSAPSVSALELRSILCQPFSVQEGLRGVIYLDNRLRSGAFSERSERLLGLLAGQAALAIRQVRRLEEIRELNDELEREVVHKESDLRTARLALRESGFTVPVDGLVGTSEPMRQVHELLHRVAPARLPVLVCGASGTGKELAARALHDLAPWKEGPFVSENCAALPATIIESELFGFVKGAFTGAESDRPGLFERASGGTLFLDEIGELPLELQAKLLRVLESQELRRVGGSETIRVDFRLVTATNRDLHAEVQAGRFREDLYYRLDGVRVEMPLLQARIGDIPALVDHFLRLQEARDGVARRCSSEILRCLGERDWPGNVRELANEVTRLCVLSEGDLLDLDLVRGPQPQREERRGGPVLKIADLEKMAILDALERTRGDKRRAAELLGISRAKIYQRLKEWESES